jgi:phosphohistidine phosphatase
MDANLELWLMRHGEAEHSAGSDGERALSERGRQQVRQFARWMAGRVPAPDLVWHSPLRRARETAELIADEYGVLSDLQEQSLLAPGLQAYRLVSALAERAVTRVVCVGHQPDIGRALADLVGGSRILIPPGLCAGVVFTGPITVGAGSLRWLADPAWFGG